MNTNYNKRLMNSPSSTLVGAEHTMMSPLPSKEKCCNRFIPDRSSSDWNGKFNLLQSKESQKRNNTVFSDGNAQSSKENQMYNCVIANEVLGTRTEQTTPREISTLRENSCNLFEYQSPAKRKLFDDSKKLIAGYAMSPLGIDSQSLLCSATKPPRKIPKAPYKVLDAPDLQDDFYLNLVDWSPQNVLSVGLGTCVYLWSANNGQVTKLCDFQSEGDSVTSVSWTEKGNHIAVGTQRGYIHIWDVTVSRLIALLDGHTARVDSAKIRDSIYIPGTLAWNNDLLYSGSRDKCIFQRDLRTPCSITRKLRAHKQEVCGLKWSSDRQYLASGGNDNKLFIWNLSAETPIQTYADHEAAVKAIAWSPHQHGLLASGGGTADRCIRFRNILTNQSINCIDTGSQVCNLAWSKYTNELVSTHGYSKNHIVIWKYPSLSKVAELSGHTYRVLYLSVSPEGESIVTGAGDETLRFWNVFCKPKASKESKSLLNPFPCAR
ncbi:Fizzy-related protein-like protein [Trichoplax sp. H2]|nr:Fizzy-related protein-like protein [Trichoplax sp. H2]|eukprot:RDD46219.1 Fizzy-related protein-like protein [Trichoplax sp. H2]